MCSHSDVANNIAVVAAFIGSISAYLSYMAYNNSKDEYSKTLKAQFQSKCSQNLDDCYIGLNEFVNRYYEQNESYKKRIARDKIIYLLEILRVHLETSNFLGDEFKKTYNRLDIEISDITYENNFEKITRDLGYIKYKIATLKGKL